MPERDHPPARQTIPVTTTASQRLWTALHRARARDAERVPSHGDRLTVGVRADDLEWALAHISHVPRKSA